MYGICPITCKQRTGRLKHYKGGGYKFVCYVMLRKFTYSLFRGWACYIAIWFMI